MQDVLSQLDQMRRPRLLIRAARIGLMDYRREVDLRRHFGFGALPRSAAALMELIGREAEMNSRRKTKDAGYSAERHVDLLIAMMGEAQILRAAHRDMAQPKASGIEAFLSAT